MRLNIEGFIKEFASSPRVSGTESEKKALDLLEERIEEIGFSIRRENFSFLSSIPQESYLRVLDKRYEILPVGYSRSGEVNGRIAFVGSLESTMLDGYEDCIVVYPEYIHERSEYESLLSSNIGGILLGLGDRLADVPNYTMFWEKWLESGRLIAATIDKQSLYGITDFDEATLVSDSEEKISQSTNLVWDLGIDSDEEIYIFAHHDSVPYSWGVTDNACGVAMLLRVCELLNEEQPRRNVVFATFGAEELRGAAGGSREFLRKRLSEIESKGALAVNIDVQGHKLGLNRAWCNGKRLVDTMSKLKHRLKYPIKTEARCVGPLDTFFFQRYMPTITFQRTGYYGHSRLGNRLDIVDYISIDRTANAIKELVLEIGKMKKRGKADKSIVEEMSKYLENDICDL